MFSVSDINLDGDSVLIDLFETEEEAILASSELKNPRIEYHFGWGSSIIL